VPHHDASPRAGDEISMPDLQEAGLLTK